MNLFQSGQVILQYFFAKYQYDSFVRENQNVARKHWTEENLELYNNLSHSLAQWTHSLTYQMNLFTEAIQLSDELTHSVVKIIAEMNTLP